MFKKLNTKSKEGRWGHTHRHPGPGHEKRKVLKLTQSSDTSQQRNGSNEGRKEKVFKNTLKPFYPDARCFTLGVP